MREGDDVAVLSVSDLDDDQRAELRAAVGALVGLGVAGLEGAAAGANSERRPTRRPPRPSSRRGLSTTCPPAARRSYWPSSTSGRYPGRRSAMPVAGARPPVAEAEEMIAFGMDVGGRARRPGQSLEPRHGRGRGETRSRAQAGNGRGRRDLHLHRHVLRTRPPHVRTTTWSRTSTPRSRRHLRRRGRHEGAEGKTHVNKDEMSTRHGGLGWGGSRCAGRDPVPPCLIGAPWSARRLAA